MQARRTLAPGQKGTKKSLERYGEQYGGNIYAETFAIRWIFL
jgi:hypothetical protein